MSENELATIVVDVAYHIHTRLGPGLLESVYHAILVHELRKRGLHVEFEKPIPVVWDDLELEVGFRADLIVENKLTLELKSVEQIAKVHKKGSSGECVFCLSRSVEPETIFSLACPPRT